MKELTVRHRHHRRNKLEVAFKLTKMTLAQRRASSLVGGSDLHRKTALHFLDAMRAAQRLYMRMYCGVDDGSTEPANCSDSGDDDDDDDDDAATKAMRLAILTRRGHERINVASRATPLQMGTNLIVDIDGVVPILPIDEFANLLRVGDTKALSWPFFDVKMATLTPALFWNCVVWANGAGAVREHGGSVVRALVAALLPDYSERKRRREILTATQDDGAKQ